MAKTFLGSTRADKPASRRPGPIEIGPAGRIARPPEPPPEIFAAREQTKAQ